jgi:hypothetical protein
MNVITITVREYAELYGCSPRYVNQVINNCDLMANMVSTRKSGGTWLIDVLYKWYLDKNEEKLNQMIKNNLKEALEIAGEWRWK